MTSKMDAAVKLLEEKISREFEISLDDLKCRKITILNGEVFVEDSLDGEEDIDE